MTFEERWATASEEGGGEDNAPPGTGVFEAVLTGDTDAFVSQAGNDIVKLGFKDVHSGHEWAVLYGFKSPKAANVTKGQVAALGVEVDLVESFEELGLAIKEKVGNYYTVECKESGNPQFPWNTYVIGQNEGAPPSDLPADTTGLDEAKEAVAAAQNGDDVPWGDAA